MLNVFRDAACLPQISGGNVTDCQDNEGLFSNGPDPLAYACEGVGARLSLETKDVVFCGKKNVFFCGKVIKEGFGKSVSCL